MKIAFLDHSYHKKTMSSLFLPALLEKKGINVDYFWDESWNGGKHIIFDELVDKYNTFIIWQQAPIFRKKIYSYDKNIIYIPMFDNFGCDDELFKNRTHWRKYSGVKYLSFSKALHHVVSGYGLASKYVQYFPDPEEYKYSANYKALNCFFWQRRPDQIDWEMIKNIIRNNKINKMHMHITPDPGCEIVLPNKRDIKKYNITFSEWFNSREEYYKILKDCSVYFAPRKSEGIGMAFLEAMAMGKCIVSPDYGTMNDYICNGINGFLYDYNNPESIDLGNIDSVRKNARKTIEYGYESWKKSEDEIVSYIVEDRDSVYYNMYNYKINYDELAKDDNIIVGKIKKNIRKYHSKLIKIIRANKK